MNAQSMKRDFYAPSPAPAPLTYARDGANRTAMEALAHKHLPLVRRIAWHIHGTMSSIVEVEDLIQIGLVALVEARSEEHTSELQSIMRISYAVFCLKKKK